MTATIRPATATLADQRPAWRTLDQLLSDNPWLPPAYITLHLTGSLGVSAQCRTAADWEAWRQALAVIPTQADGRPLDATSFLLEATAVIGGAEVTTYVIVPCDALAVRTS